MKLCLESSPYMYVKSHYRSLDTINLEAFVHFQDVLFRLAISIIAEVDPSDCITVCTVNGAFENTIQIREKEVRERIYWTEDCKDAQCMINNYRNPNAVFDIVENKLPISTATVDDLTFLSVYRIE